MSIRVTGIGTLTRDAEVNETAKGAWVKFGLATKRQNAPEGMQDVDFFESNYFLKNPKSPLLQYLKKGTSIFLNNAEMRADQYEKDGQKRTMNKIMIFGFDLLSTNKSRAEGRSVAETKEEPTSAGEPPVEAPSAPSDDVYTDEIPF